MKNLSDQQISALIDGTADAALKAQVAANAHLQAQLDAAQRVEAALHRLLYRWDCPTPDALGEYQLQRLPAAQREALARHLAHCRRCRDEVALLADFLATDDAPPRLALESPRGLPLLPPRWDEVVLRPSMAPYDSAWRGADDDSSYVFEAPGLTLFLEDHHNEEGHRIEGQLVTEETSDQPRWSGALVELRQDESVRTAPLDEFGEFTFDNLALSDSVTLRITNRDGETLVWSRDSG